MKIGFSRVLGAVLLLVLLLPAASFSENGPASTQGLKLPPGVTLPPGYRPPPAAVPQGPQAPSSAQTPRQKSELSTDEAEDEIVDDEGAFESSEDQSIQAEGEDEEPEEQPPDLSDDRPDGTGGRRSLPSRRSDGPIGNKPEQGPTPPDALKPEGSAASKKSAKGAEKRRRPVSQRGAPLKDRSEAREDLSPIERAISPDRVTVESAKPEPFSAGQLTQFGYGFFRSGAKTFKPAVDVPVSFDYLVGPGDRLTLHVWGSQEGTYELDVNRSGEVVLPRVGAVKVWGVPFGKVPELFRAQLAKVYRDFNLDVNLGKLRLIKVFVVGEVGKPGSYDVSALSTVLHALQAAGGPSKTGTLRRIQVLRSGKLVETVDLYDFFLKGDNSRDVRLLAGDTVFVPTIGKVAGIGGNVLRPAIYELTSGDTLKELLELAGGLIPTGYLQRVQVYRVSPHEKNTLRDVNLDPKASGQDLDKITSAVPLQTMDVVTIFPIDRLLRGYVRLDGHVVRPGDYALKPGMRLKDLVPEKELLPEYNADAVQVTRYYPPDLHPEVVLVSLRRALAGDPEANLELREFDKVKVYSRWQLQERPRFKVTGEVQKPGSYPLTEGMTVRDAVLEAGGLKLKANRARAELVRIRREGQSREAYRIQVNLEEVFKGVPEHNVALAAEDALVVRRAPLVPDATFTVKVAGQVRRPGEYRLYPNMRVSDLVAEAGGLVPLKAYLEDAEINRLVLEKGTARSFPIHVRLGEALKGSPPDDIALAPHDDLFIRTVPDWVDETERYVVLKGEFRFPGTYPIYKGERLSSVIERAGGFTEKAYLRAAKFTRASVKMEQQQRLEEVLKRSEQDIAQKQAALASTASSAEELAATRASLEMLMASVQKLQAAKAEGRVVIRLSAVDQFKGGPYDVELMGGDGLEVPQSSSAVSVLGEVYNPTTVLSMSGKDVRFYLEKAGGPTGEAEARELYVIRADGSLQSRKQRSVEGENWFQQGWFSDRFMSLKLEAGDTVVVPKKLERTAWMREIKDITQIISQVALTAGVLLAAGL